MDAIFDNAVDQANADQKIYWEVILALTDFGVTLILVLVTVVVQQIKRSDH